jgi:pimeloyl-ACP methyl ester carboxylesterase
MTTLVLLPGMDGTGALFAPLLRSLPSSVGERVVAYPARDRLGYAELARFVEAALPRRGDYVLLGESFSGPVAIAVAARGPARLRGLVLACSFASTPLPALSPLRHLARLLPSPRLALAPLSFALMGRYSTPALRQALAAALAAVEPSVLRHRAASTLAIDAGASLCAVKCPVLYLQASEDRVVPASCASQVRSLCPQTQVVRLAGPHFLLQTQPAAAAAAIETFIGACRRVARAPSRRRPAPER